MWNVYKNINIFILILQNEKAKWIIINFWEKLKIYKIELTPTKHILYDMHILNKRTYIQLFIEIHWASIQKIFFILFNAFYYLLCYILNANRFYLLLWLLIERFNIEHFSNNLEDNCLATNWIDFQERTTYSSKFQCRYSSFVRILA